ncbi:hypothetical protein ASC94_09395 [Massilia sp. Root418]|uniref:DUF2325 domain-containing protein n=1 Tax=Massilia sp. Root418 TaxID=1736532 RepID=UPI0006F2AC18|nr:DUF2325 domain-containing protein [Massilia sp. Root418]KQW97009.1 hypothetical protein ASC94_09395 [Massilia sp. Root418]
MCDKHQAGPEAAARTSRRRRLWELGHACHCPLVGVGMPLAALRKLVGKVTGGTVVADDYEVHVGVVTECGARNRLSEALQKELERRYAGVLLRFKSAKDAEAVAALWRAAVANGDVAGAFWAGLTHARCSPELEEQMCRDLHMVQHQAGACARADITRFHAVLEENSRMARDLARLQQRNAAMQLERNTEMEQHASQLMQLRAQLVGRDSLADSLRHELAQLRASIPGLETRDRLAQRLSQVDERERALRNQVAELKQELARAQAALAAQAAQAAQAAPALQAGQAAGLAALHAAQQAAQQAPQHSTGGGAAGAGAVGVTEHVVRMPERLAERSILCVGGRTGNVATYRALIERVGAQFAHHDGGLEDNANKLEASLAAADLVICQTGCISHSAYWRVKDFCKRTGKRCVFIDNPSISSLARGLEQADLA